MKKRIMCAVIAVFSIVIAVATANVSAAAKKAPAKSAPAAKASTNPLLGSWSTSLRGQTYGIKFLADKIIFDESNMETPNNIITTEMKYKFSKSPLAIEFTGESGKLQKLSMSYSVSGDNLVYSFENTKTKPIRDFIWFTNLDENGKPQSSLVASKVEASTAVEPADVKKATIKKTPGNRLVGKWKIDKESIRFEFIFTDDKLEISVDEKEGLKKYEMKYKFSASPVKLEYKTADGKVLQLVMKYKVEDFKLTYRFVNTNNKPIPGMPWGISQVLNSNNGKIIDGEIIAQKDRFYTGD